MRGESVVAFVRIEDVVQQKGQIELELPEHADRSPRNLGFIGGGGETRCNIAQGTRPALGQHGSRSLGDRMEETADLPALVLDRRMGEGEEGFLELAVEALEEHPLVFEEHSLAGPGSVEGIADSR